MSKTFARGILYASLMAGAAVGAQSASAAIIFGEGNSAAIDNKVHAYSDATHLTTGTSVYGITDLENALVKFTGNTTISITGGSGYAQIFDADSTPDWDTLTISMADGSAFSGLEFALQFLNADVSNKDPGSLLITVNYVGGSVSKTYSDYFTGPGNQSFFLYGNAGEAIQSVVLSAAPDHFDQLKQTDINLMLAPVPEAGTWAMLLTGFAAVGSVMRRRRTSIAFA